jgi:hypothetical protein
VFEFLRLWGEGFSELHIEVEELIPMDDRVVAVVHQYGVAASSGAPVELRDAHVWIVEDGLVKPHPALSEPRCRAGRGPALVGDAARVALRTAGSSVVNTFSALQVRRID